MARGKCNNKYGGALRGIVESCTIPVGFVGPTREEPFGTIYVKVIRGYSRNFGLRPVRHRTDEVAESLLLHDITGIRLSCI